MITIHSQAHNEAPMSLAQEQQFGRSNEQKPLSERARKREARREDRRKTLWQQHYEASSLAQIGALLDELNRLEDLKRRRVGREDIARLRPEALQRLLELAGEDVQVLERALIKYLLPVCCRPDRDKPALKVLGSDVGDYWRWREPHLAREMLKEWLEQLSLRVADKVRAAAISYALRVLQDAVERTPAEDLEGVSEPSRQARAALHTIGDIGFRAVEVEEALLRCIERPDAVGTVALSNLVGLGVPLQQRAHVNRILRQHLSRHSHLIADVPGLGYSLQEFADPPLFGEALETFHQAAVKTWSQNETSGATKLPSRRAFHDWDLGLAASRLARLLKRFPYEAVWHRRFWRAMWATHLDLASLSGEPHATFLNSDHIVACDVPGLARDILLQMVPSYGDSPGDERHAGSSFFRTLSLETLEKCVGEKQLHGMALAAIAPGEGLEALPWLERDATRSTGVEHTNVDNSLSRHKRQTWRLILHLEIQPPDAWLDALRNETNAHTTGRIYEALSCLSLSRLPEQVWTNITESYDNPGEGPFDQFVARMGAQRLAASSASRRAFEALLECGFTHGGQLMAATVDHLSAVARQRHAAGDMDVVPDLLKRARHPSSASQRELALGALRSLALGHHIGASSAPTLLFCARAKDLSAYARALAVEALGFLRLSGKEVGLVEQDLEELFLFHSPEQFPPRRNKSEHEIGWNAAESLVRLGQWRRVRGPLLERLSIAVLDQGTAPPPSGAAALHWRDVARVDSRRAFLATLIMLDALRSSADDEEGWQVLVCDVVRAGASSAAFAVLRLLLYGKSQTELPQPFQQQLVGALRDRIARGQTSSQSETYLFAAWVKLAPNLFIDEPWERQWSRWLPDARVALAKAIDEWAVQWMAQGEGAPKQTPQEENPGWRRAVQLASLLSGDGLFVVRRSAYKAMLSLGGQALWLRCLDWTFSNDAQLRRRAAEATAWLADSLPPRVVRVFLFGTASGAEAPAADLPESSVALLQAWLLQDAESAVRQACEAAQEERRKRLLADKYLDRTRVAVELAQEAALREDRASHNRAVLQSYRYARALTRVGSDIHLGEVREILSGDLAPSIRFWLDGVGEKLESNWKTATQKWPDPWLQWEGVVEELEGRVQIKDEWYLATFTLRHLPGETPHEYETWEGTVALRETESGSLSWGLWDAEKFNIDIPGRLPAAAHVVRIGTNTATLIRGNGPYPSPLNESSVEADG